MAKLAASARESVLAELETARKELAEPKMKKKQNQRKTPPPPEDMLWTAEAGLTQLLEYPRLAAAAAAEAEVAVAQACIEDVEGMKYLQEPLD